MDGGGKSFWTAAIFLFSWDLSTQQKRKQNTQDHREDYYVDFVRQ